MALPKPLSAILRRRFSFAAATAPATTPISTPTPQKSPPVIANVRRRHRSRAMGEAQKVMTEYLHGNRSLPFVFAELIAKNAQSSLSNLIRRIHFSPLTFGESFRKFLRYEPINEFEFFLESIGIDYDKVERFLPRDKFFFSEDRTVFDAAFSLSQFGFPWNTLGKLYEEEISIFTESCHDKLMDRLRGFTDRYGLDNLNVVGLCLAFPSLLSVEGELGGDVDETFLDLKRVFVEFEVENCTEGNVDAWYQVCCKVRFFYDLGCEKGKVAELMCKNKELFLQCSREVLVQKADYFNKLGIEKVDVGMLLLQSPEILSLDLETRAISVLGLLKHFGLDAEVLQRVSQKCPYVFGRNKMANLPHVMRALDLHEWFFDKVKSSTGQLLATYAISSPDEDIDEEYVDALKRIEHTVCHLHTMRKVEFLKGIGFGENALTVKLINPMRSTSDDLPKRFDYLLRAGVKYSKICSWIRMSPNILSQCPKVLEEKLNFLCGEMGCSMGNFDSAPGIFAFDLDRIKYRYKFHVWLRENGLCNRYSISSIILTSEKSLIARFFRINPAIPKQYLERFSKRRFIDDNFQE